MLPPMSETKPRVALFVTCLVDLYRPTERAKPLPAIVCIHGGGWYKGDRSAMTNLAMALAARGFVTASISYRLSGEAKFPAAIQDAKHKYERALATMRDGGSASWLGVGAT